jgi:single-strand DNA-binding protein
MVNKVILVGNVGGDVDVRMSQNGTKIASFSVATNENWKDKQTGERKSQTTWHRIVIFNENLATICEKYIKKGTKLFIEGTIANRKYTDKDGIERNISEVVIGQFKGELTILDSRDSNDDAGYSEDNFKKSASTSSVKKEEKTSSVSDDLDDEIPF